LAGSEFQIFGAQIRKARASPTQDCTVKQTAGEKRKITEFVRVHEVIAIQLGKVAGECV